MSARLCAVMKRAHLQLSDRAARTESTGSSVPPGLKESWYRDVFIFLVPTWYRSTGSFDNPNIYIYLICIYLYFCVLLLVFSVICMHQGSESNAISILCMYVRYMWQN